MANRNDSHSVTPRRIKRWLAMAEANGEISDAHRRGEVRRLMQSAHRSFQVWHKKMLTQQDNADASESKSDARSEDTSKTS